MGSTIVSFKPFDQKVSDLLELHYDIKIETYHKIIQIIKTCLEYGYPNEQKKGLHFFVRKNTWFTDFTSQETISWSYSKESMNENLFVYLTDLLFSFVPCIPGLRHYRLFRPYLKKILVNP
jgi:hypothetical protein